MKVPLWQMCSLWVAFSCIYSVVLDGATTQIQVQNSENVKVLLWQICSLSKFLLTLHAPHNITITSTNYKHLNSIYTGENPCTQLNSLCVCVCNAKTIDILILEQGSVVKLVSCVHIPKTYLCHFSDVLVLVCACVCLCVCMHVCVYLCVCVSVYL